jgi:hypothetical protein
MTGSQPSGPGEMGRAPHSRDAEPAPRAEQWVLQRMALLQGVCEAPRRAGALSLIALEMG